MWIKYKNNLWVDLGRKVSWLWMGVPTSSRRRICCRMVLGVTNICLSGHPFSPLANKIGLFLGWKNHWYLKVILYFLTNALICNQENLMETMHINVFYYVYNVSYIFIYTHILRPLKIHMTFHMTSPFLWKCKGCVHLQYIYIYTYRTQTPTRIYIFKYTYKYIYIYK